MNTKRIILGGLPAGVIIFGLEGLLWHVFLNEVRTEALSELGMKPVSWGFPLILSSAILLGLLVAWLYAAIRPRFGSGLATSVRAGVFVWMATFIIFYAWNTPAGRGFIFVDPGPTVLALLWSLAGVILATMVAGWIYREEE